MKQLKSVKYLIVHCVANKCTRPFSVESLINTGLQRFGQVSYHYYVRYDGSVIPLLPESVQGIHVKGYNYCSLGIVYEGGLDANGKPADTRTEAQKHSLYELLKALTLDYPTARILGHCELLEQRVPTELVLNWPSRDGSRQSQFPRVHKRCPCYLPSKEYADLQPKERHRHAAIVKL